MKSWFRVAYATGRRGSRRATDEGRGRRGLSRFFYYHRLIRHDWNDSAFHPGRPDDPDLIHLLRVAKPEVQARERRRGIPQGRGHRSHLVADDDAGADSVSVAPRPDEPHVQPVPLRRALVLPELCLT